MKVAKFGGSSLASASQIRKVFDIVKADPTRKFIVVSAPGKRDAADTKVTDALISYHTAHKNNEAVKPHQDWIIARYQSIADELDVPEIMPEITNNLLNLAKFPVSNPFTYDSFLSAGEDNSAKLIAAFFTKNGLNARYVSPQDAGIRVSEEPGQATLLPHSYEQINYLNELPETLIIPGFFGVTEKGEICTFSRGGSDITGSIIAAGVKADLYENFTDVDGICAVNPNIVPNSVIIEEVTYREMRELASAGFAVLHDEALIPAARAAVPMVLKNTNNPAAPGTRIVPEWTIDMPVIGVASSTGFAIVKLNKYLLQRELGFVRKFFEIFEQLGIHFEAITTGIDDLSVLVREIYLTPPVEEALIEAITESLRPDDLKIVKNLAVVAAVGEEIRQQTHITGRATNALWKQNIKIETLMQGASEVSLLFILAEKDEKRAIRALYKEFFI